jgi:hypothetical protein
MLTAAQSNELASGLFDDEFAKWLRLIADNGDENGGDALDLALHVVVRPAVFPYMAIDKFMIVERYATWLEDSEAVVSMLGCLKADVRRLTR